MKTVLITLLVGLVGGFGGGWVYQSIMGNGAETKTGVKETTSTTASTSQTLEQCLTEVWGADKYAAIGANASLATTEDNFQALSCYQTK